MFISVSPLQLLHGVVVASIEVFPVSELSCRDGLLYVISGILAGGIPGFRIGLCCFTHTTVWLCECCVFWFSFALFCHTNTEVIQCCHLFPITSYWTGSSITFLCVLCVVVLVALFGFVVVCVFCCFGCCLWPLVFWRNRDGCWTMYRSHTSSLLRPPYRWRLWVCIN